MTSWFDNYPDTTTRPVDLWQVNQRPPGPRRLSNWSKTSATKRPVTLSDNLFKDNSPQCNQSIISVFYFLLGLITLIFDKKKQLLSLGFEPVVAPIEWNLRPLGESASLPNLGLKPNYSLNWWLQDRSKLQLFVAQIVADRTIGSVEIQKPI